MVNPIVGARLFSCMSMDNQQVNKDRIETERAETRSASRLGMRGLHVRRGRDGCDGGIPLRSEPTRVGMFPITNPLVKLLACCAGKKKRPESVED